MRIDKKELLASHDYAKPNTEGGRLFHGGIDAGGSYRSPRTLNRWPAIRAWREELKARGWDLVEVSPSILGAGIYPNVSQQKFLLNSGFGRILWDAITETGRIESRAGDIATFPPPDFQKLVCEDVSDMLTGHLAKGLLIAHGYDEAGDPERRDLGAHDAMWFGARDLAFGVDAFPLGVPPGKVFRPGARREMPQIPVLYEQFIKFLMNLLMLEVRGDAFFEYCCALFRDPSVFEARKSEAEAAARVVERISADEASHIAYLQVLVSELRHLTFRTVNGETVPGSTVLDPVWRSMVEWHAGYERRFATERRHQAQEQILAGMGPRGHALLDDFHRLETGASAN